MDCIFNELSAQPVIDLVDAHSVMAHFVQSVVSAQRFGFRRLRIPEELGQNMFSLSLTPAYSVGSWLNDERVDQVLRDRFRAIIANPPLLTADEVEAMSVFERSVFSLTEPAGKPEAKGFGAAYLGGMLLLSLLTHNQWNSHQLDGWHWYLEADGQEQSAVVTVPHFATSAHFELHRPRLQQQQDEQLQRSIDVWEKRIEFFPNLILCGDVKRQLKNAGMSNYLSQIIERLRTLDSFAADWKNGDFDLKGLNAQTNLRVSGESDSTMRLYSGQRKFKLPDGRRETFELHIKIGDLRFHFYPDNQEKRVYVGYIGPHLSIVTG
ncbi:hypothetical protein [Larkinella punicea]|uniref:Uncharacterized protein n=1 Tax=Larkinella punicea TaxID=2315727 RepID=A0A368JLP2_9BACT|nr:hypothetical protein [Larkinella punicea]RCR68452.1 hypothetical protein DUE52_17050 [Larkinella punicea]